MSAWTHAICAKCWSSINPGRQAITITGVNEKKCCFCGENTSDGIYVRHKPELLLCKGVHDES